MSHAIQCVVLASFMIFRIGKTDEYVQELFQRCNSTKKVYHCNKWKFLDSVEKFTIESDLVPGSLRDFLRVVKEPNASADSRFFRQQRQFSGDSEIVKLIKFVKRKTDRFLREQGLVIPLMREARVLENASNDTSIGRQRGKKKKELFIPLLILFKLFKIKVLVSIALAGILFIKKTILLAALVLPWVVQAIRNSCRFGAITAAAYHATPAGYHHSAPHHYEEDVREGEETGWGYSG